MNRDEALAKIFSRAASERLDAARFLSEKAQADDLAIVRLALGAEGVPWIRSALELVRERLENEGKSAVTAPQGRGAPQSSGEETVHDTIGQVLHELTPAIGRLKMAVMSEYEGYVGSSTEREFEKLAKLIDLFSRWRRVNSEPRYSRVDLEDLLREVVEEESAGGIVMAVQEDPAVPLVLTDREFLKAAVANGLRNAVQAIEARGETRTGEEGVTISYGVTDREYWISVLDDGIGLTQKGEAVFASTTDLRPGRSGLGLPIAREAVSKLGGRLSLRSAVPRGAKFLIEVPLREVGE